MIGILCNFPLSAYLTFGLVQVELCTLSEELTACWWSGIFVLIVSITGLSSLITMQTVPQAIKLAIVVGMGLLIAMIGMISVSLIVANPKTLVELGDVRHDGTLQLCLLGILLVASLLYHDIKGSILFGIATLTILQWTKTSTWRTQIVQLPALPQANFWELLVILDLARLCTHLHL